LGSHPDCRGFLVDSRCHDRLEPGQFYDLLERKEGELKLCRRWVARVAVRRRSANIKGVSMTRRAAQ